MCIRDRVMGKRHLPNVRTIGKHIWSVTSAMCLSLIHIYYTQQMYGQNAGTQYITSHVTLSNGQEAVRKRVGISVVKDEEIGRAHV